MNAGKLRHRIEIQHSVITKNAYNERIESWQTWAFVWAQVSPLMALAREEFVSGAAQEVATARRQVRIRYRQGVTVKMRIIWEGKTLEIRNVLDPDERRREYVLLCEEIQ